MWLAWFKERLSTLLYKLQRVRPAESQLSFQSAGITRPVIQYISSNYRNTSSL